jgi:hypothetical protein
MIDKLKQGWGFPFNARKYHYFYNGTSLCGKYTQEESLHKTLTQRYGEDDKFSETNCKECTKVLIKQIKQEI